jgi:hypothetical protein
LVACAGRVIKGAASREQLEPTMQQAQGIDVQSFLNEHPFSGFQWLIFAMCFFIVLLDGFDTAAIGYIAPSLLQEWGVARPALAPVLSAALFGLAFGALSFAEDRHDYDIHQRVRTSCAFARSGASIGLKFRAYLVARAKVRAARAELDLPEGSAKPLRRCLRRAAGAAQRHSGD